MATCIGTGLLESFELWSNMRCRSLRMRARRPPSNKLLQTVVRGYRQHIQGDEQLITRKWREKQTLATATRSKSAVSQLMVEHSCHGIHGTLYGPYKVPSCHPPVQQSVCQSLSLRGAFSLHLRLAHLATTLLTVCFRSSVCLG